MKKVWLGLLGIFGLGAGIGFFAGERYGRKQAGKELAAEKEQEQVPDIPKERRVNSSDALLKDLGYVSDEDDMDQNKQAMDEYLSQFEHPAEEEESSKDDTEDHSRLLKDCIDIYFDEDLYDAETEYTCQDLAYYLEDEVLCDDNEKRIEDPEEILGPDALPNLVEGQMAVIYVKNHWNEHFYRITAVPNAYGRVVLGLEG